MYGVIGGVVVPGTILVFAVLVLLIGCVYLMSNVVARIDKKVASKSSPTQPATKIESALPDAQQPVPASTQQLSGEVVAAISGAISCVMKAPHVITNVTPVSAPAAAASSARPERRRPVWGFAGMQQNTRPF